MLSIEDDFYLRYSAISSGRFYGKSFIIHHMMQKHILEEQEELIKLDGWDK